MKIVHTPLDGMLVIEPRCFRDPRGYFLETFQYARYGDAGIAEPFVQDNHSRSSRGVLRGMHFQRTKPQGKLVTVIRGHVFDVGVDLRAESPTFGRWYGVHLSDETPRQIYLPPGFAHGFCVLSDWADLHYKVTQYYDPADEGGVRWNDPGVAIEWPVTDPVVTPRDAAFPRLDELPAAALPRTWVADGHRR